MRERNYITGLLWGDGASLIRVALPLDGNGHQVVGPIALDLMACASKESIPLSLAR